VIGFVQMNSNASRVGGDPSCDAKCGICGEVIPDAAALTRYKDSSAQYYWCSGCSAFFLYPLPTADLNREFEDHEKAAHLADVDLSRISYFERRLDLVEEVLSYSRSGRLLEIGSGSGSLLRIARDRGWDAEGVELSGRMADISRQEAPDIRVRQADFVELQFEATYDAIVALDVLEHLVSPSLMLRKARSILNPGGVLLIQTPNAGSLRRRILKDRWNMLIPEYHFHLFNENGLTSLLKANEFEIISSFTVSGTGDEQGPGKLWSRFKECFLSKFHLGNALVVLSRAG